MPLDLVSKSFLKALYPWFPIWAFLSVTIAKLPFNKVLILPAIGIAGWIAITKSELSVPRFLKFLLLFTGYHLLSSLYFETIPTNTTVILYTLSDYSVLSCFLIFIVCNTSIDEPTLKYFDRHVVYIVVLSLIVSLIQIQDNTFFTTNVIPEGTSFKSDNRLTSIYSWYDVNSLGITFPIFVSLALASVKNQQRIKLSVILLSLVAVSFLTKARYVMISGLIVFSQLLLSRTFERGQKIQIVVILAVIVMLGVAIADQLDYSIQKVVDDRILERDEQYSSALGRVKSVDVFLYVFPKHCWFGVGPTTRDDVRVLLGKSMPLIHVGYLSYLYYYGALGASLLFIAIGLLLREAFLLGRSTTFWGIFYGMLTFCFANTTFVYFNFSEPGVIVAIIYMRHYSGRPAEVDV